MCCLGQSLLIENVRHDGQRDWQGYLSWSRPGELWRNTQVRSTLLWGTQTCVSCCCTEKNRLYTHMLGIDKAVRCRSFTISRRARVLHTRGPRAYVFAVYVCVLKIHAQLAFLFSALPLKAAPLVWHPHAPIHGNVHHVNRLPSQQGDRRGG
jgi:hypothetical protein